MKRTLKYYKIMWLRHDLAAGLSVFLVALPLCLGIALASGAPLYAGLLSGIIGGLVVALVSGSPLAVSGPAAGLSTLVAATIVTLGDYKLFLLTVVVAGLFQLLLGILKWGAVANYFPSSVIKGMLAAIGIMLMVKQVPLALGYDQPDFWRSGFLELFTSTNVTGNLVTLQHHITPGAILIFGVSLAVLIVWQLPWAKKLRIVPASLVVVLIGIGMNLLFREGATALSLTSKQLVDIPANLFANIQFPDLKQLFSGLTIWKNGIIIGLLATLETLLCIEAIDKLDRHNRITPVNRELVAQGAGNMLCGLLGAIPLTAVVVRGSANVNAGARTRMSAITHGAFLLLAVVLIPFVLNLIPYASLAAILMITGYNLTRPALFSALWRLGWKQFLPFVITVVIILATDLLMGVSVGLLLSIYFIIQNNFRVEYRIIKTHQQGLEMQVIKLNSNVTFLNKVKLKKALDEVPPYSVLTIDGNDCNFIDYDILEIISEFELKAHDRHIELRLEGIEKVRVMAGH
ncbi:MAG: SulP family inorganic anion transporter [Candidatus Pseudobacter hemicellulosilyticus]|uniref:SulP family inorganic anion transporter n=1 Tax=Candidatus Pseudobacter hemicellulosilyticus TaxID=3121375 RepID=A0AAJ6BFA7_9BACT|nr:MAG: SulP family inorganic anion transporter [Pseudobacter sp.]